LKKFRGTPAQFTSGDLRAASPPIAHRRLNRKCAIACRVKSPAGAFVADATPEYTKGSTALFSLPSAHTGQRFDTQHDAVLPMIQKYHISCGLAMPFKECGPKKKEERMETV
jgi:hypothetical protein